MCNCINKALKHGYVKQDYYSESGKDAYIKRYFIKVSMGNKKTQEVFINNCMWCGEKLPISEPKKLRDLPFGFGTKDN